MFAKESHSTITWSPYLSHSSPIFKRLGILKLLDQFKLQIALFMFKSLHNLLPVCCLSFQPSLRSNTEINTRINSQMFIFHQPRCRTILRERSIMIEGPKLWNSIPLYVKIAASHDMFKNYYSRFILSNY